MKHTRSFLLILLVIVVLITGFYVGKAAAATGCFSDTNAHWAETYICWLKDNAITTGYGDGTFLPNNNITRAEMAVMLKRANAVPPQSGLILFSAAGNELESLVLTEFKNLWFSTIPWIQQK